MIRTDIFRRGVPWMLLIKRSGTVETDLNVKPTQQALRGAHGAGPAGALLALPWNPWRAVVAVARIGGDRLAESRLLPVPRPPPRPGFRGGGPAAAPALLHLLRRIGPDRPVPVARRQPGARLELGRGRSARAGRPRRAADSPTDPGSNRREAGTLDNTIKVAVVRTDRRRGGVAEALALIADDLRRGVEADLETRDRPESRHPRRPWTCTHRDTLSAAADALLGAGASSITIVAGTGRRGHPPCDRFDRLGYRAELWSDRPRFSTSIPTPGMTPGHGARSAGSILAASRSRCASARAWPLPAAASRWESPRPMASSASGWDWRTSRGSSIRTTDACRGGTRCRRRSLQAALQGRTWVGILARLAGAGLAGAAVDCGRNASDRLPSGAGWRGSSGPRAASSPSLHS